MRRFLFVESGDKMIMKTALIFLAALLSGCLYSGMDDPYSRIDPLLQPYFDSFKQEAEARGVNLDYSEVKINFGPIKEAGLTRYESKSIIIAERYRDYIDEMPEYIETVVFHELGHLVLGRKHKNDFAECPKSLMHSTANIDYGICLSRNYYIDELFLIVD